jgi:hypothetical protein
MLRTTCIWCGKTVRGGDDWAGRSGKCPNCGAEIIFPRMGPPPTEPAPAKPFTFINPDNYWLATDWGAVGLAALCGVAAWIWVRLIIFLAYGLQAYRMGLRIAVFGRLPGVTLNNGDYLSFFWATLFVSGFITTWAFLIRAANHLVGRTWPRGQAIALVLLVGLLAWISLLAQAMPPHPFPIHFGESPARQAFAYLIAIFAAAGIVVWRDLKSGETSGGEIEMISHDAGEEA